MYIVERIENLNMDAAAIAADIKAVYEEAKDAGYDTKCIRKCVALRAKEPGQVEEEDEKMKMYRQALDL